MLRKILAFITFNAYSWCFVWVFVWNTAYVLDSEMADRLVAQGFDPPPHQWGWGNHYLWRLLAAVVSTGLAGFLAGAVARTKAGITVALSNVPSIIYWIWMIYFLGFMSVSTAYGDEEIKSHIGMVVISIIAIPLTIWICYYAGEAGAETQRDSFQMNGVLGIAGYHWIWLILPIYTYSLFTVQPLVNLLKYEYLDWNESLFSTLIGLVLLITAVASFVPLYMVYERLKKPANGFGESVKSAGLNFLIVCIGFALVGVVQYVSGWLLNRLS